MSIHTSALRAARDAQGWSQTEAARALAALAHARGVPVASTASLKTQLSRWENGHATPEAPYRALLAEVYAESAPELASPDPEAAVPADRLRARLAAAAAVDSQVIDLWHDQLATAQQLDDRLGATGAAHAAHALLEQLEAVLPHLPDPERHRPVAALLARALLLAGTQALDTGDPDEAVARFTRAVETARGGGAPDLAAAALIGHAEALLDVGARLAALAVLEHGGIDVAHPPAGLPVELAPHHRDDSPASDTAIERLAAALARNPRSTRERAALHAELAEALTRAGRADEAADHARAARALAIRIGSRRVLRRLDGQGRPGVPSTGSAVSSSASAAR